MMSTIRPVSSMTIALVARVATLAVIAQRQPTVNPILILMMALAVIHLMHINGITEPLLRVCHGVLIVAQEWWLVLRIRSRGSIIPV